MGENHKELFPNMCFTAELLSVVNLGRERKFSSWTGLGLPFKRERYEYSIEVQKIKVYSGNYR